MSTTKTAKTVKQHEADQKAEAEPTAEEAAAKLAEEQARKQRVRRTIEQVEWESDSYRGTVKTGTYRIDTGITDPAFPKKTFHIEVRYDLDDRSERYQLELCTLGDKVDGKPQEMKGGGRRGFGLGNLTVSRDHGNDIISDPDAEWHDWDQNSSSFGYHNTAEYEAGQALQREAARIAGWAS